MAHADTAAPPVTAITYPMRPLNGGPWPQAARFPKPGEWYYEPKYNGWRTLVHVPSGTMFNRKGQRLSIELDFSTALRSARQAFRSIEWIDCEALERRHGIGKGTLIVLDYLPAKPGESYKDRRSLLGLMASGSLTPLKFWDTLNKRMPEDSLLLTMTYRADGASQLWDILKQCNEALGCEFYEGFVVKRADSPYTIQLRSPDTESPSWVKHRWAF